MRQPGVYFEFFMFKTYYTDSIHLIELLVKKISKKDYSTDKIKNKLQHPDFDENKTLLSDNKLIKWIID